MDFKEGLYEQLITKSLKEYIDNANKNVEIEEVEKEEANIILAKHLKGVLELALRQINEEKKEDKEALDKQISLSNKIIKLICEERGEDFLEDLVSQEGKMLYAITPKENSISNINKKVKVIRPKTPLTQSSLFTNATNEPNLANELSLEIRSSDSVDILVSFIKWSGIRILKEA